MELKRKIKVTIINLAKVHFNRNFGKHLLLFLNTENPQCFSLEARTKSKSGPNYKELPKFTAKHCLKIALTIPSKKKYIYIYAYMCVYTYMCFFPDKETFGKLLSDIALQ